MSNNLYIQSLRKTIIVGTGSQAMELESKLKASFTNIYQVIGYVSSSIDQIGNKINNLEVVGSLENINKVLGNIESTLEDIDNTIIQLKKKLKD